MELFQSEKEEQKLDDSDKGKALRWALEFNSARKNLESWWSISEEIVMRYKDDRSNSTDKSKTLNLFTSNIETMRSMLFGKVPTVDVARRFADAKDDVARVGAEMMERLLNTDIEYGTDGYTAALESALDDRLLVGMGNARVIYNTKFEQQEIPAVLQPDTGAVLVEAYVKDVKVSEDVVVEYVYWKDQLWSPCRTFNDCRWWAFKTPMNREKLIERFGDKGKLVPLNSKNSTNMDNIDGLKNDPWSRADVWEIWDKDRKCVEWYVDGYHEILDYKKDTLELEGFWPFPKPMFAHLTTSSLLPVPDFKIAQDLYKEIDTLTSRIVMLEQAISVRGVGDKSSPEIKRLLNEAAENEIILIENWSMFAEKGGIKGVIDWLPIEQIQSAIATLTQVRQETMGLLYQVTGMSDIMRGQSAQRATATEQSIKARFASVRIQHFQDEFARFASDIQSIKAKVISKFFDPETIYERSNIQYTPDARYAEQAIQLIKSEIPSYRVSVKPDSVSLTDYAALKQERTEVLQSIGGFLQVAGPIMQMQPAMAPHLMRVMQWMIAGVRGGDEVESIFDEAIDQAEEAAKQPQQQKPDPRMQAEQMKMQGAMMQIKAENQSRMQEIQAETMSEAMKQKSQADNNIRETMASEQIKARMAMDKTFPGGSND